MREATNMHTKRELAKRVTRCLIAARRMAKTANASDFHHIDDMTVHVAGYAERGYDEPKSGLIVTGNWNDNGSKIVKRLGNLLERLGVSIEWSDEWSTCDDCGKLLRTSPDCHCWEPSGIVAEASLRCNDCAGEPAFDRWDVCLAYWHAAHGWNGTEQASKIQARLARLKYKPSHREEYSENIPVNAALILREIDKRARKEKW